MTKKLCLAFALFACLLILASGAYAQPICIGLQEASVSGGAITNEGCVQGTQSFSGAYGTFTLNNISGTGAGFIPEPTLDSTDSSVSSSTAGTLTIYVTAEQENLGTGVFSIASSFTVNSLPAGWTVEEQTFVAPCSASPTVCASGAGDGPPFLTTDLLNQHTFSGIGTQVLANNTPSFSEIGWSETEVYTITTTGSGSTDNTIETAVVPEPASIMLFGSGLLGLVGIARRRFLK